MRAVSIVISACLRVRFCLFLPVFLLFHALLLFAEPAAAGTIVVKPGKLDHFVLTAPKSAVAGESFIIRIEPYDASGNMITTGQAKGSTFHLKINGAAEVTPDRIRPTDFSGGVVATVTDKTAETVELRVMEGTAATPLATVEVQVQANKLDHFTVSVPKQAVSGEAFQARIIARDSFGNTKFDLPDIRSNMEISSTGTGMVKQPKSPLPSFRSGEMIINFEPVKVGTLKIAVTDTTTHSRGESGDMEIKSSYLDHFVVQAPEAAVAGEVFTVTIAAMDRHDNPVAGYKSQGDGVLLISSGDGILSPSTVSPGDFRGGQAKAKVSYTAAGSLKITVREMNGEMSGQSEKISILSAEPNHFVVTSPDEAVAGEAFAVEIEALDRFNNPIGDYDLRGLEVYLSTDGTGTITPSAVSPSAFTKGKAKVSISYDKAESFSVIAALSKEDLNKIIKERTRRGPAASPPPARTREEISLNKERELALKAREEALKARMETEEEDLRRSEALKAREEAEEAMREAVDTPPLEEREEVAPAPPDEETVTAPPLSEPLVPARIPLPDPAPKKPALLRVAKRSVQELTQVSFIESRGQAMIMLETSGPISYNASTGSAMSKEWIYVELFPISRDKENVKDLIEVDSELVGDVLVEEMGSDKVKVSLQVIPPGVSYVVSQQDRAVVVKIIKND